MKVKLFYVASDNWVGNTIAGLYTEKEFEDLKKEIIEDYRNSDDYIGDIRKTIDDFLIYGAALGRKQQVEEFKAELRAMEEETLEDFIDDYVTIYEKEL